MTETKDYLSSIIGQHSPKSKLNFYLDKYPSTKILPNMFFGGPKGGGKTLLARETAKNLIEFDDNGMTIPMPGGKLKKKPFIEINASSIKSLRSMIESLFIEYVNGKACTVFIDEASELPKECTMALLTMLNPNKENKTTFSYKDYVIDLDFAKQTFILASSEPQKIFHALLDRLTRIDLEPYSNRDLAYILQRQLPEVEFEKGLAIEVSTVLRENPRNAVMFATRDLFSFLGSKKTFNFKDWEECKKVLSILPLGLNPQEVNVLKLLKNIPEGSSLTALAARSGLSRQALQRDSELYLLRHNLMSVEQGLGRCITQKGLDYLKELGK